MTRYQAEMVMWSTAMGLVMGVPSYFHAWEPGELGITIFMLMGAFVVAWLCHRRAAP